MPVLRIVAVIAMVLSASQGARLLLASSHSVSSTIMAIITVAVLTIGLCVLSEIAFLSWKIKKYGISALAGCLVAVLYMLSVSGQAFSWITDHRKESSKLEIAKTALAAKNADVLSAEQQLSRCNPAHVTKCIKPAADNLAIKQNERDKAVAELALLSDAAGVNNAWADFNAWLGLSERKQSDIEFNRDMILAAFVELLAIIFYANPHIIRDLTEEVKKNTVTVQQLRIDTPQPDIIPTQPPVEYQPQVVANEWVNFEQQQKNVVKFIMDLPAGRSVAILGQSGFGKSSLLGHLAIEALNRGHTVFALDPHFNITESSFDPRCQIIGKTANGMAEIKQFIFWLKKELDKRELELKTVPYVFDTWQTYVVLMDEMFEVINQAGLTKEFAVMYTKMRKYKIVFLGISQSFNVKSMGVEGNQDLLKSFEIFQLSGAANDYKITHEVLDDSGKRRIVKNTFSHPGTLKFSHIPAETKQSDFKPVLDSIVNVSPKELKKNLNSDIFY